MTRAFRFPLLVMLIIAVPASAPAQTQSGVAILLAKARSLEARGRIDLAADNWHKVLLVNPNQTEALAGLARSAKENGQAGKEDYYLDRLRKIDPKDPEIAAVEKLRVLTPEERSRLDEAGQLAMQHKPDEAMKIYREVLGDQLPPLGKWAQRFYETEASSTGGRAKAIAQLRKLCAEHPQQEAYRLWLASLMTYDPATRVQGFQLLESIKDPGFAEQARAPWRRALLWEKDNPQALAPIEAYLQRYPDQQLQSIAAALRAKQQQIVAGEDQEQGFKALRGKHLETAAAEFNAVLSRSPNDANALVGLGYVRLDQKRFSEAFTFFDRARKIAPQRQDVRDGYDSAQFWMAMQRGADAQKQDQSEAAALAYKDALALRPLDNGALLGLANALVKERRFSAAEAKFQQVLNQDPSNVDALAGLGFVRLNQGQFNDAQRLFAKVQRLDPNRKDVDLGYSNARFWGVMHQAADALSQSRLKTAVTAYQQAVSLNPGNKDALHGLADARMRAGDYTGADKTYHQLIASYPSDQSNWLGLIRAQLAEQTPQAAVTTAQSIPPSVRQKLESSSDFPSEMALVYCSANLSADCDQALQRALQLSRTSDSSSALGLRLQLADKFMERGKSAQAIEIYIQATQSHPNDPSTWEALVGAYVRESDFLDAATAVRSMPKQAYDAAVKHPSFLNSVALVYSAKGQCSRAEDFLQRSFALARTTGRRPNENAQLQQADIWMREHSYAQARDLYHEIITNDSYSAEAWRGYLVALHLENADRTLVAEIRRIPSTVRTQLETDPNFLVLEASAYSSAGRNPKALPLLEEARTRYTSQHKLPPVNLDIQTAWTMLAISPNESGLGDLLRNAKSRTGLTLKQRAAIQELWSVWSVRRAELAFETKPQLAFSILEDAGHVYPGNRDIQVALASLYLRRNDKGKALDVFQTWDMAGAQAADYRMAAGTALSAHKDELADQFLKWGVDRFPNDPGLLHMTAKREIARGNYDEGEQELRTALQALHEQGTAEPETRALIALNEREDAARLSVVHDGSGEPSSPFESAPPCRAELSGSAVSEGRIRPVSLILLVPQTQSSNAQAAGSQQQSAQAQAQKQREEQQMEGEVEAVNNRNTPVITVGGTGTGRVGDAGIDRLVISDSVVRSAYTLSNRVRFSLEGHGVYAYSGTPDGSSNLPFGTLPAYALFGEQSKIGYGGVAQLSTNTLGAALGTSPQGFAVHNWIGGIRFRPLNGWFTFLAVRDSVKDSLLSYAGARDPGTGIRWGGVVSNTGTVKYDSAPADGSVYKRFGEYGSASYSFLQGLHVPDNWSVSGNAGFYWQMVPGLTLGLNTSAMHYNRNLSYFSFGQGGYFSPQQYYLASIPISWYSRHQRFEYKIKFSGGLQYLHEDSSLFYPVLPGSTPVTQGVYSSDSTTAPNYDLDIRLGYHMTPHLYFGTFATANNAQNYYEQSAGFSLKFMFDRIPTRTDLHINSIPDWRGNQPFTIR
jgi:tetratricopeptide (TPR) repeat protein